MIHAIVLCEDDEWDKHFVALNEDDVKAELNRRRSIPGRHKIFRMTGWVWVTAEVKEEKL